MYTQQPEWIPMHLHLIPGHCESVAPKQAFSSRSRPLLLSEGWQTHIGRVKAAQSYSRAGSQRLAASSFHICHGHGGVTASGSEAEKAGLPATRQWENALWFIGDVCGCSE